MRTLALLVIATTVLAAAPVPKELRQRPSLVGTWRMTATDCRGVTHTPTQGQRWDFAESIMKIHPDPEPNNPAFVQTCRGSYTLDANGHAGWYDFSDYKSDSKSQGLYECDGGTLRICFVIGARGRPADMKSGADKVIYTFRRVKE